MLSDLGVPGFGLQAARGDAGTEADAVVVQPTRDGGARVMVPGGPAVPLDPMTTAALDAVLAHGTPAATTAALRRMLHRLPKSQTRRRQALRAYAHWRAPTLRAFDPGVANGADPLDEARLLAAGLPEGRPPDQPPDLRGEATALPAARPDSGFQPESTAGQGHTIPDNVALETARDGGLAGLDTGVRSTPTGGGVTGQTVGVTGPGQLFAPSPGTSIVGPSPVASPTNPFVFP